MSAVALEGTLRLTHDRLPSLAALPDDLDLPSRTKGCVQPPGTAPSTEATDQIWVFGDSIVAGRDILEEDQLASVLAVRGTNHLARRIRAMNHGQPAGDICTTLDAALTERAEARPAGAVIALFQNDLMMQSLVRSGGGFAMVPTHRSTGIRSVLETSYAANYLWFHHRARTASPSEPLTTPDAMANIRAALAQTAAAYADVPTVWIVLDAVGTHRCPIPGHEQDCGQAVFATQVMADELTAAGIPFVDFRGGWQEAETLVLSRERKWALPVHPNPAGVEQMADAVWPELEPQLQRSP
ncbi:MAG: hypothetical protein GY913_11265 [Proteobacteria bacterium]|nr:hypothetical protein [Pseudomonadota bacterium]MCP4917493.1 hypothetical protein [Pseudomonadota bacterium]